MFLSIIPILKEAQDFTSGQELSRRLGVTRAAVWKHIEELRAEGYEIEALPRRGYRLVAAPDRLSADEVKYHLDTKVFGIDVEHFESVESTMTQAFRSAMDGAPEGAIVIAERQTRGRGRLGRVWASPRGKGLYFSIILRPGGAIPGVARLTLLAAVAVSASVEKITGVRPLIKWPNDLLVNDRKICGILTEMSAEIDRVRFVVVGIGLNVNTPMFQLPPEATSLKITLGKAVSRVALLQEILRAFESRYFTMRKDGYAAALDEWRARSAMEGRAVRFVERGREIRGTAAGIDDDGGLLVRLADGTLVKRMAGDIIL
jgi:BirA family biotin operon repressor/biotin-[acetyl-CoA-carboxylase] ligase